MKEFTYLLSYPRSGNHFFRYIVEWFTGMYTTGDIYADDSMSIVDDSELVNPGDPPIFKKCDMPELRFGPILKKRHKIYSGEARDKKLIFLKRDFRESVVRQLKIMGIPLDTSKESLHHIDFEIDKYVNCEKTFLNWTGGKMQVNYENLKFINKETIISVLTFLEFSIAEEKVDYFLENLQFHKNNAFRSVGAKDGTSFNSDDLAFHQNDVPQRLLNYMQTKINEQMLS